MLVALSDLHFQDAGNGGDARAGFNTAASQYRDFFESIQDTARECGADEIMFLLNGDIFDFLRTECWFATAARPYDDLELSAEARAKVMEILEHAENSNRESLELFEAVARNDQAKLGFAFHVTPRFVFVPGNHDRYFHMVPEAAAKIRKWLALGSDPFRQALKFERYGVFARHGHEYDWLNSEYNFEFLRRDAKSPEVKLYRHACLGDWLSIDVATRIPYEYKRLFGNLPGAEGVYRAIVEIDDVRPLTSVFAWLQNETGADEQTWKRVRRAIEEALRQAFAQEFVQRWIRTHDRPGFLDRVDFLKFVLTPLSRNVSMIPDSVIQACLTLLRGKEDRTTEEKILSDAEYATSGMPILCHGHFHDSGISFLDSGRVVICTGSWRARHSLCHDGKSFYKGRSVSYAVFYTEEEARRGGRRFRFDFHQRLSG